MLKNYFKTAFRNLLRNKSFSFINIIGLSIGISAALVIFLIVQYDFSFDKFHKNRTRIYRVVTIFNFSGETYKNSGIPYPLANTVRKESTGLDIIIPFTRWQENQKLVIPAEPGIPILTLKKYEKPIFTDESYFKLIPYHWIAGNAEHSLLAPNQVVITEKVAHIYFPRIPITQIIGKEIVFDDTVRTTVTGIVKNLEGNTDFNFTTFISRITLEKTTLKPKEWDSWNNTNGNTQLFVQIATGTKVENIVKQTNAFLNKYAPREKGDNTTQTFQLQPLADLHFNAEFGNFDQRTAHKPTLFGLLAVAIFLLLLGCINFINLTTAQASQRAKEIGIRKTMGSSKKQLIFQFLSETFLMTFIATLVSIVLTPLLLKIFSDFIPPELHFNLLQQPILILFLILLVMVVSLFAGVYPAWILSSFNPIQVLKNQSQVVIGTSRKAWIRKSLTISQFIIAQVFILATLVVSQQIHYSLNKDLGFKRNAIIYFTVNYRDTSIQRKLVLAENLKRLPEVSMVGLSTGPPTSTNSWSSTIKYKNGKKEVETDVEMKFADTQYLNQFQLKLKSGKNIPKSDTVTQFLINETYAKLLGFSDPKDVVGKYLEWSGKQILVSGVLSDFHQKSLHEKIKPLAIGNWGKIERVFSINLQSTNKLKLAIEKIELAWKNIYPEETFEYEFLDETISKYYKAEQNISSLLKWATGLAIFISCLGLLGLVMFTTNIRKKEIGVRKVLGATVLQIISILSVDFLFLVVVAFLFAAPAAWWAMHKWLENYAYKTTINIWLFIGSGFITLIIALLTIGFQTYKAATANPVKSLRTE